MIPIKTELTFKLYTITDLSDNARKLVSPFTRFTSSVQIQNINRPEEKIILLFQSEKFIVALDWTSFTIHIEGNRTDLKKPDGQFRFFFDILDRLTSFESFNGFKSISINMWDLIEDKHSNYKSFKEKFLNQEISYKLPVDDAFVMLQGSKKSENLEYSCKFGPFKYPNDIKNHNLNVFDRNIAEIEGIPENGLLVNTSAIINKESFDFSIIEDLFSVKSDMRKVLDNE